MNTVAEGTYVRGCPGNPQCTIIEGMFLINTNKPLRLPYISGGVYKIYFILTQFSHGSTEVHVIFDKPGKVRNTPKSLKQSRCDSTSSVSPDHTCEPLLPLPKYHHSPAGEKTTSTVENVKGNLLNS